MDDILHSAFSNFIIHYSLPLLSSFLVGLCGIFPLLIIPTEVTEHLQSKAGKQKLNRLLSFAIGSMLGDVFLHLLPEAFQHSGSVHRSSLWHSAGLWTIIGIVTFFSIEKLLVTSDWSGVREGGVGEGGEQVSSAVQAEGYLNLFANFVDNLTHGLAVGGGYALGVKVGLITTCCILVHEIPHEISDFAILLRAGFHKWKAAKAQLLTASGSVLGASLALTVSQYVSAVSATTVLPFTSGGFLYLALASLTPSILTETRAGESALQCCCIVCGFSLLYCASFCL